MGGKYLRAPDIFFTILDKGKGKFVKLGDIANVKRGFTTGCNEFSICHRGILILSWMAIIINLFLKKEIYLLV